MISILLPPSLPLPYPLPPLSPPSLPPSSLPQATLSGPASIPPTTVCEVFKRVVKKYPGKPALRWAESRVLECKQAYTIVKLRVGVSSFHFTQTYIGTVTHTCMHTHTHTRTHACTHTHSRACRVKRGGEWETWTWRQYYIDAARASKSMVHLGLEEHHGVCLLGFNAPEWFIGYMAGILVGCVTEGGCTCMYVYVYLLSPCLTYDCTWSLS